MACDRANTLHEAPGEVPGGFMLSMAEALELLPEEDQRLYRESRDSIIEARRSANRVEGQIVIG